MCFDEPKKKNSEWKNKVSLLAGENDRLLEKLESLKKQIENQKIEMDNRDDLKNKLLKRINELEIQSMQYKSSRTIVNSMSFQSKDTNLQLEKFQNLILDKNKEIENLKKKLQTQQLNPL